MAQSLRVDVDTCITSRIELLRALQRRGWDVVLVAGIEHPTSACPSLPFRFIALRQVRIPLLRQLLNIIRVQWVLLRLVALERIDHVILDPTFFACGFPLDVAARLDLIRTRYTLDVRSGLFHRRKNRLAEALRAPLLRISIWYGRTILSGITTITDLLRDTLRDRYWVPAERVGVWHSGVSLTHFAPEGPRIDAPELRGKFVVLYHGTFGSDRGLPEAVAAMELLASNREIVLVLLGSGVEEPTLRALVRRRCLRSVHIAPAVPHAEVPRWIRACDVGLIPLADTEVMRSSSPLKLMEYLAMRKPVIVPRFEAFTQVLEGTRAGIFLDSISAEAIADAVQDAWKHRSDLPGRGAEGRRVVESRYTWDAQARRLEDYLSGLVR